jgi:hypothetical protein
VDAIFAVSPELRPAVPANVPAVAGGNGCDVANVTMKLPEEVDHSILVPDRTTIVVLSTVVTGFVAVVSETLIVQTPPLPHGGVVTAEHFPGVPAIAELTERANTNQGARFP